MFGLPKGSQRSGWCWFVQEPVEKRAAVEFGRPAACLACLLRSFNGCSSDVTPYPPPQAPLTPVFLVAAPVNLRESRHVSHLKPR